MKKQIFKIGLLITAVACGMQLFAKPAKQGVMTVSTADGGELCVRLVGDEYFHQYFTEDGYPLVEREGNFYYCNFNADGQVIDSDIKAKDKSMRGPAARSFLADVDLSTLEARIEKHALRVPRRSVLCQETVLKAPVRSADGNDGPPFDRGYGLFPDLRFPAYGDQKAIVILVEFQDEKFHTDGYVADAKDYFTRMLNEDGFSDLGATGSAAQFFRENSGDSFRPEFDVFGPVTLANNMSYYGGNDWTGSDKRPADMVKEACEQLDDVVDFSEYDRNNDGIVDNVFVFFAGRGEASGGGADTVWPHSWNMASAGYPNLYFDGVRLYTYGCSNEWEKGRPDGVGTFVHEFSHVMGLPDLYATSYTSSFTPGAWSALDYGPYNNNGMTPPNYGAFERYALGWIKPNEIDGPLSATLHPVSENVCGVIRTDRDTEFFLIENRQREGWDAFVPGHGMLIWHVDYNDQVWMDNRVNNSPSHQYVDIEEADGSQNEYSRGGDAFPGTSGITSFTSLTSPAMKTWNGTSLEFPITDIAERDGVITFNVSGGAEVPVMPVIDVADAEDVTAYSFKACWNKKDGYDYLLSVYCYEEESAEGMNREVARRNFLKGFRSRNVGDVDCYYVTGLEPDKQYFYTVAASSGWFVGAESEEMAVSTGRLTLDYYTVKVLKADNISDSGFTANWEALDEADDYILDVYTKVAGDPYTEFNGFDDGVVNMGDWVSNSSVSYGIAAYCGKEIPSLRLGDAQYLETPVFDDFVSSISFWHRGNKSQAGDMIYVYAVNAEDTETLVSKVDVNSQAGGVLTTVSDLPADAVKVRLTYVSSSASAHLALDDVSVSHGHELTPALLEDYTDRHVGNVTSFDVTDLDPGARYFYTVRATDGVHTSRQSKEMEVNTSESSVKSVAAESGIRIDGLVVSSANGDSITVADYTGSIVAHGSNRVILPCAGLYILTVPARGYAVKIIAR